MILKKNNLSANGFSTLVLIFIIASLSALVLLFLQLNAVLAAKRAAQVQYSQSAFFAAEGAFYQAIGNLRETGLPDPTTLPVISNYTLGDAEINVTIEQPEPSEDILMITVKSDDHGAKRKIVGYYGLEESVGGSLDLPLSDHPSCAGFEVNVDNYDRIHDRGYQEFDVLENESYIVKQWPGFVTVCNDTGHVITIPAESPGSDRRKWYCQGICPAFDYESPADQEDLGHYEAGTIVHVSSVAILDDNPLSEGDTRRNCITLDADSSINSCPAAASAGVLIHTCEDGWKAPPCEYTLEESGNVRLIFDDSVGLVVGQHVGLTTEGETFWFKEVEPEPDATPTP